MMDEIKSWMQRCVRILKLDEYEIALSLHPTLAALGECVSDPVYQSAVITLRDPAMGNHPDWKRSLLHELIHVRMGGGLGTEPGSEERSALERGVEMMTRILHRMISSGVSDAAISRAAQGCARTLKTAREGTKRGNMDAKRIIEIVSSLSAMAELPEEAKKLVGELAALAVGGDEGAISTADPPMKDAAAGDKAIGEALPMERNALNRVAQLNAKTLARAEASYKTELVKEARSKLGAACTPAFEAKLMASSPEIGEALLEGACSRGDAPKPNASREVIAEQNVIPLRRGEKFESLTPLQRRNRANIAEQIGTLAATQALQSSKSGPVRTVGRPRKEG